MEVRNGSTIINPGDTMRGRGIRWLEPDWEFDCPLAIIAPIHVFREDGCSLEYLIESFLIDCCIDGKLPKDEADPNHWRGYTPVYLKRKQYRRGVERADFHVRFVLDRDGLTWEDIP